MTALTISEISTLDELMSFLRSASPWFKSGEAETQDAEVGQGEETVLGVCGNWYDVPHKALVLARLAAMHPAADLLLMGGREERLTPADAVEAGGEPLLLQRVLSAQFGLHPRRTVVYTGSRVTNHNLRAILHYAKQVHEFTGRTVRLHLVEEGFLVRREAAALAAQLREDSAAACVIAGIQFEPCGPNQFEALVETHQGRADIALALVLGEHDRLQRYTVAGTATTVTHGLVQRGAVVDVGALDALEPSLAELIAALRERHKDGLLSSGKHVLERLPREQMLPLATPLLGKMCHGQGLETSVEQELEEIPPAPQPESPPECLGGS